LWYTFGVRGETMFTIYSKAGCPFCHKVQEIMTLGNFEHEIKRLGIDYTSEEFYSEFGEGSTFPQVILDGQKLGGCVDTAQYIADNNLIK